MCEVKEKMSVNSLIKTRRLELGLTMKDVAKAVGVSEGTISRWESGEISNMKRSRISDLAKVLKLSPLDITGGEPQEQSQPNSSLDNEFLQILATMSEQEKEWLLNVIKSVIDRRK